MAGKPRRRALIRALEKRARAHFECDLEMLPDGSTILDYAIAWTEGASGNDNPTLTALAASLSLELGWLVTRPELTRVLESVFPEETGTALDSARQRASHTLAEGSLDILDAPAATPSDASRAKNRAEFRRWLAGVWNDQYREKKGDVNVAISLAALHLDALRSRSPSTVTAVATPVEAEIVPRNDLKQIAQVSDAELLSIA
jgi:hypothetical protein